MILLFRHTIGWHRCSFTQSIYVSQSNIENGICFPNNSRLNDTLLQIHDFVLYIKIGLIFSVFYYIAAPVTQFDEFYQINEVCAHFPSSTFNFMCRNSANELKRFDLGGFTKSKIKLWWITLNSFCLEYNILKIDDFFRFLITHIESIKELSHSEKNPDQCNCLIIALALTVINFIVLYIHSRFYIWFFSPTIFMPK